jgi:hypothetical protein
MSCAMCELVESLSHRCKLLSSGDIFSLLEYSFALSLFWHDDNVGR